MLLFMQLVFTGISYPKASVVLATATILLTVIGLEIVYAEPAATAVITVTAFAGTGLMAYLQFRNHDRRARVLSDSEQRLAEAQAIAHIGSWEWRADTGRLEVSAELRRIFGGAGRRRRRGGLQLPRSGPPKRSRQDGAHVPGGRQTW